MSRAAKKTGLDLLLDPTRTKSTSFTSEERDALGLTGLLPHAVEPIERQVERVQGQLDLKSNDLERYVYMTALLDRDETLFYRVVMAIRSACLRSSMRPRSVRPA